VVVDGMNGAIEHFELNGETLGYTQMIGRFAAGPLQGTNAEGRRWQYGGKGNDSPRPASTGNAILGGWRRQRHADRRRQQQHRSSMAAATAPTTS
jgi:hypothetical protein